MNLMSSDKTTESYSLGELTTYQVGALQSSSHRALKKHKDALLQDYGITGMQWYIIGTVLDAGEKGMRITDLAKYLDTTMAFLTNTVNLLESKGILMRTSSSVDSRSRMVSVTAGFRPICAKIETDLREKLRESLYSKLSREDLETYIKVISRFTELN